MFFSPLWKGCFQYFVIINNAAVNGFIHYFAYVFVELIGIIKNVLIHNIFTI